MEPMTLGSPVGSPTAAPHAPPVTTTASSFFPSFLMGDVASPAVSSTRVGGGGGASPNKTTRQFSSSATVSTPGSPQPMRDSFFISRLGPDKPGGPPTQSLMGVRGPPSLPQSPVPARLGTPIGGFGSQLTPGGYGTPGSPLLSTSQCAYGSAVYTPSRDHSSFFGQDSLQLSVSDVMEDTWVTVFGFPAAAASYILTQFTQLGTITEHRNPGSGNWMHLKYQTKLQARKALSKNGKVFSGNIMVGVLQCNDKTITGDKENMSTNMSNIMSPDNSSLVSTPKSNMRPLSQAYQTAHAEHEVIPKVNTPKKNDSLVSRAMQHILGM
ncbi:nucleoporin NUP35-like isoform X2 [Homarus americanus]|uniref:nucleoporin NUP35-like isoform X2 n=1 Tax=Homarus americanus TaxID=6706 RepID=UPI001C46CB60|nr:nucleoporin NUP35-like isoform X2 [Homarus americanus]